jgi:hypothetical protein
MDNDPANYFISATFGLMMISGIIEFVATARLAKWLCHHHPGIWRELGRPGTTFFKGEEDNGYFSRTTALNLMHKSMPLQNYHRKLVKDDVAQRYLRHHRLAGRWGAVFLFLFAVGIFVGIALREGDAGAAPGKSETRTP